LVRVADPSTVFPSRNCTVPVTSAGVTDAVSVTICRMYYSAIQSEDAKPRSAAIRPVTRKSITA
jgi:hypothetical protein